MKLAGFGEEEAPILRTQRSSQAPDSPRADDAAPAAGPTDVAGALTPVYRTGGPVDFRSPVYIARKEDDEALRDVLGWKYVTIIAPRQMGKTSLLFKLRTLLREQRNVATAVLDLMEFNWKGISWNEWLAAVCSRILDELAQGGQQRLDVKIPQTPWELKKFFAELVEAVQAPGIVVLIDEAASAPVDIRNSFYSVLRVMYNERSSNPLLQRCSFVFCGVFAPYQLVENDRNSPFNVSEPNPLYDFSREQVRTLCENLKRVADVKITDEFVQEVFDWTQGHPYLTQRLLAVVADKIGGNRGLALDAELAAAAIPELRRKADDNISYVVGMATKEENNLRKSTMRALLGRSVSGDKAQELELLGVIKQVGAKYRIRNKIYQTVLEEYLADDTPL